jgi:Xaa-Pro aminopeptidase
LIGAGYETSLRHRTGHSLGWHHGHGDGPNLDAIEFPDERVLAPGLGVTVEPGVYLDGEFGVRLEVSLVLGSKGATLTTQRQTFLTIPGRQ